MLRSTTCLIVLFLAGGPAGPLVCDLWCSTPEAESHHRAAGCHQESQPLPGGQHLTSTAGCHDAAALTLFVTEARQTETASVAGLSPAPFQAGAIGPENGAIASGWCVLDLQPRHPASSRAVLRV